MKNLEMGVQDHDILKLACEHGRMACMSIITCLLLANCGDVCIAYAAAYPTRYPAEKKQLLLINKYNYCMMVGKHSIK